MARPTNIGQQLMNVFQRSMQRLAPTFTLVPSSLSDGSPALFIQNGSTKLALAAIQTLSYSGFNVVGNISSAAGEGTPEHQFQLVIQTDASGMTTSKEALIAVLAARMGCASTNLYEKTGSAPAEADITTANLQQSIDASAEYGTVGA